MIVDERITAYINSLDMGNTELLNEIEEEAKRDFVPVIRREMQSLLKTLLAVRQPRAILEVGTAVGFSALLMCEYAHPEAHITTIEKYEKRIPIAKENFRRAGREERITLLEGRWSIFGSFPDPLTLFLWMRPRGSIFIFFPMCCGFWRRGDFWCWIMFCRTEI